MIQIGDMLLQGGIVVNPGLLGDPTAVDLIENPVPHNDSISFNTTEF